MSAGWASSALLLLLPGCRDVRLTTEKKDAGTQAVEEGMKGWDPAKDPNIEVSKWDG